MNAAFYVFVGFMLGGFLASLYRFMRSLFPPSEREFRGACLTIVRYMNGKNKTLAQVRLTEIKIYPNGHVNRMAEQKSDRPVDAKPISKNKIGA